MLQCLSLKLSSSSSPSSAAAAAPNGNTHSHPPPPSQGGTSSEASPSATLTHEYTRAVQSQSYNEIWSKVHQVHDHHHDPGHDELPLEEEDHDESDNEESRHRRSQRQHQLLLGRVLQPNRECVQEALRLAKPNTLTRLVSDYFDQSENTTQACLLLLHRSVYRARELYAPLHQLLDAVVHSDSVESSLSLNLSLSQSQCRRALDVFLQFDLHDNPFPSPDDADSPNLDNMRRCFSQLKLQLDSRLRSSRSKIRLIRRATLASALCFIGTAVGVAVSAVAVTVHALTAALVVVAAPPLCCTATSTGSGSGSGRSSSCCNCSTMTTTEKKEIANMKQLDAAAMGTCVLDNDLATIDRLVRRLHAAVEGDKLLVRLGLERGSVSGTAVDKHPIQEVMKQLHKSHPNFLQLVDELEEHICLCFNTVNRSRSLLFQHINTL
ncbi:UPF0496 protein At3g19330 [Malus sylvestris]|uniref:UPF0496 protein At3g19330 n=1 Tax=Malus sylvestris TaxID=3752 RepID=UPI0021AD303F|nr:UPF0496 protein At3g19330 [Malus sylvestris]